MVADFLPEELELPLGWSEDSIGKIYEKFYNDFVCGSVTYSGKPVKVSMKKGPKDMLNVFWHIITKEDKKSGDRLVDFARLKRIFWIKEIILNPDHPDVLNWEYEEKPGKIRVYLWVKERDYVVVLEKKTNSYFLVTAFNIEGESTRRRLRKKYKKGQKNNRP